MANNRARGYIRNPDSGVGVPSATVTIKRHVDDTAVTSDGTDAAGQYAILDDAVGYPGPVYEITTVGATTKVRSGFVWGQLGGMIWASDISDVFAALGIGVISGLGVTTDGLTMASSVAAGSALLKDGIPYVIDAATPLTHAAADATNPRIDRIMLTLTREGQTEQGKIVLGIKAGTPAASPAAPSLTQTSATWQLSLAQVRVNAAVTVLATDKVTDERAIIDIPTQFALKADKASPTLTTATLNISLKTTGPSPSLAALAAAGSTATPATPVSGNSITGFISVVPSGTGIAAGSILTMTFAAPLASSNYAVMFTPASVAARNLATQLGATNRSTTSFDVASSTPLTSGLTYSWYYWIASYT